MKYLLSLLLFCPSVIYALPRTNSVGNICHTDNAPYNYGGVWELSLKGNLVCNYWRFLGDDERENIESLLDEYGELPMRYIQEEITENDEYHHYWEVEDRDEADRDTEEANDGIDSITGE